MDGITAKRQPHFFGGAKAQLIAARICRYACTTNSRAVQA